VKRMVRFLRPVRRWFVRQTRLPRVGTVDFGDLARLEPVSRDWGFDRGTPVDRFYIEGFLDRHSADIRGRVLEVADNAYTRRFGGDRVERSDILQPVSGSPKATLIADLGTGHGVPESLFHCVICTQTLQFIYDVRRAAASLFRMLRPGGVLLLTVPGISQISREDMEKTGDYWRFTNASLMKLLSEHFGGEVTVECAGNVYAATAFLHGIAVEELDRSALEAADPQYQMMLLGRAVRQD
jgi:SAM-dependent methyltransferase